VTLTDSTAADPVRSVEDIFQMQSLLCENESGIALKNRNERSRRTTRWK